MEKNINLIKKYLNNNLINSLILNDVERAVGLADEALVVRHDDHAALVLVDGLRQRVYALYVQVVRWFVLVLEI